MLKFRTKRGEDLKEVPYIVIHIGDERYRISHSINGGLVINKISDGVSDDIIIRPNVANQIEIQ